MHQVFDSVEEEEDHIVLTNNDLNPNLASSDSGLGSMALSELQFALVSEPSSAPRQQQVHEQQVNADNMAQGMLDTLVLTEHSLSLPSSEFHVVRSHDLDNYDDARSRVPGFAVDFLVVLPVPNEPVRFTEPVPPDLDEDEEARAALQEHLDFMDILIQGGVEIRTGIITNLGLFQESMENNDEDVHENNL